MAQGFPQTQVSYFPLIGGLDLVTPPLAVESGKCREAQNFEVAVRGGYSRIDGYERFSGQASPSDAVYHVLACTFSGVVAVDDTITGATSTATGKVIAVEANAIVFTKLTGVFSGSEVINVSATPRATATAIAIQDGASTTALHAQYRALAANVYRADIAAVTGSGAILGVWTYNGDVYCFRNNVGGTAANMWKSSSSGWVAVTTPALLPSGHYEFYNYNFGSGLKMYGCDSVNKGFQFDGTTFTQITTGMTVDVPNHVACHKNHLFFAFDNSLQSSAISDPLTWTPILGASEINLGETITNTVPQSGDSSTAAMAVYSRNGTFILYGNSSADWKLTTLNSEAGAYANTAQQLSQTYVLDDRGITSLQTTQNFGNFSYASLSELVRPFIIENKSGVVATCVSRDKSQYRVLFSGGKALYMTMSQEGVLGIMPILYGFTPTCAVSKENNVGNEVIYYGGSNGYVYQIDRGNSFDGGSIEAYLGLVFNHEKSPRLRKRYRKAVFEVGGNGYSTFAMSADLGYSNQDIGSIGATTLYANLSSGRWDIGSWDVGVWDGRVLMPTENELTGTAENIALRIGQNSSFEEKLTFYGVLIHWTARRLLR